jgi:carboxyl-terminal processing protease
MDEETGTLRVLEVYEDSPAMEGGLQSGDVLLALDGESLEGSDLQEAVSQIKAKEGTFTLKVYRESLDETLELSMACDEVALNYVQTEMMRGQTGYIRITEFTKRAAEQFEDAAAQLQEQGVQQLIVDLRGNPGGLLTSVCDILDTLSSEQLIVYTEDKAGKREEYYTAKEQLLDCPVAVLVDGDSASASEIFAGAIQDWGRGPIVGTQTYGKGIVQQTFALSDGSAIKFTVSRYYTPNGQDIHGNGITPDIIAAPAEEGDDAEDSVLAAALDALLESNETEQQEN